MTRGSSKAKRQKSARFDNLCKKCRQAVDKSSKLDSKRRWSEWALQNCS
jgi:hypothetical protein